MHKLANSYFFNILMHDFPILYSLSIEQALFEDKTRVVVTDIWFTGWLYSHELLWYPEHNSKKETLKALEAAFARELYNIKKEEELCSFVKGAI